MRDQSGLLLWILLGLFCLRVLGQLLVVIYRPRWLPPMSQWYSGLIPYPVLLPIQVAFVLVMGAIAWQVSLDVGPLSVPRPSLARGLAWFACAYAGSMAVRYVVRMARRPDQRWWGGTIPIIFHCVLAAFLLVLGSYCAG